ncbi:MAG: hypothetical protein HY268_07590 [Deltaproteobacteria bacterium]|nr:hypothetical protein [Deltaproteobacteria bacterium]
MFGSAVERVHMHGLSALSQPDDVGGDEGLRYNGKLANDHRHRQSPQQRLGLRSLNRNGLA